MNWFWRLFRLQPKVWLRFDINTSTWQKIVSTHRPGSIYDDRDTLGPFRSEVDAEETADRMNAAQHGRIRLYHPIKETER